MLNLIFVIFAISALLNCFLFEGSLLLSILVAVIAAALLVFRIFLAGKVPVIITRSVSILCIILLILAGFLSGIKPIDSGYLSYDASIIDINNLIEKGQFFKAGEKLDNIEKSYGSNDTLRLLKAQIAIGKKDTAAAEACLSGVADKQSDKYYTLLGRLYVMKEDYANVQAAFVTAAKAYPLWTEAQLAAGTQSVNNKDYSKGEYFLLRAAEQDPKDPVPVYYLGVIRFEQGNYIDAGKYFDEALRMGLGNEYASYAAWYRRQMGGNNQ